MSYHVSGYADGYADGSASADGGAYMQTFICIRDTWYVHTKIPLAVQVLYRAVARQVSQTVPRDLEMGWGFLFGVRVLLLLKRRPLDVDVDVDGMGWDVGTLVVSSE